MRGVIVALVICLAGCAPARPSPRRTAVVTPRERPATLDCVALPTAVAGFRIGDGSSFGRAGTRCIDEGYRWTPMDDGGTCSGTPERVPFPASARVVSCRNEICALQIRFAEFDGETAFGDAATSVLVTLREQYGVGTWHLDENRPCPRVEGDDFGCVLDGVGIVDVRWNVADRGDADPCGSMSAGIALRVEGGEAGRGTDGRITVTYYTWEAVEVFSRAGGNL